MIELNISERLNLLGIFPGKEVFEKLVVFRDVMEKIKVTQKEIEEYEIKTHSQPDGRVSQTWSTKKMKNIKYEFTSIELVTVDELLKKISTDKTLTMSLLTVFEKFRDEAKK